MKILQINKFFYLNGGADKYFFEVSKLLKNHGHKVIFFSMKNQKNLFSKYEKYFIDYIDFSKAKFSFNALKNIGRTIYSLEAKRKIEKLIKDANPDIAHIHNIYHQISPSILHVLKKYNIPVVMTLHDYKLICPSYNLTNALNSKIILCEKCKKQKYYNCFLNKCVKNSYFASALNCLEAYIHNFLKIYEKNIDKFIAPSQFMKDKCVEFGINADKIIVLPNFVNKSGIRNQELRIRNNELGIMNHKLENYILYFGRLSKEKGIDTLLKAVSQLSIIHPVKSCKAGAKQFNRVNYQLRIVGSGDLRLKFEKLAKKLNIKNKIKFFGHLEGEELQKIIREAMFVVVPSIWYENCPLSILESFALGKSVIASKIGGIPELIKHSETGLLFEPGNAKDLANKIECLLNRPDKIIKMGQNALKIVREKFNADEHYKKLIKIYVQHLGG
ncbi:MAG: glycosyltransferase family 4 protein [Patescibacteria group bacterium]